MNRHGDRTDDVQHVEKGYECCQVGVLGQVIKHNVLDQVTVGEVGERPNYNAKREDDKMRNDGLFEHSARLILLGVDVENSNVALEDAHHFAHKER